MLNYYTVILLFTATLCYVQVVKTTKHEYLLANHEYNASVYNENKQTLPLVYLLYVNTSEFEKRDAYYFRCYAISNAPVKVKWMFKNCPSGDPTCERPFEQLLKNTLQDTSKTQYNIFITDVHININETGTLVCNASNSYGNSIKKLTITGTDSIEVWPDASELALTSGENRTFLCKGNIPVQWYFNQYNQISPIQKESSAKLFSKSRNSFNYFSRLLLTKVSYFDVGYYYCGPLVAADVKLFEQNFKKIYVYVRDETHLIAAPEDLKAWYVHKSSNFIIPCRPTSPDVNVTLYADHTNGSYTYLKTFKYDQKIGYLMPSTEYSGSYVYRCNANRYDISESQIFSTLVNPERPHINVSGGYFDHITTGQNINLHCSVSIKILFSSSYPFELHWVVNTKKLQTEYKKQYFYVDGSISFNIDNVTTEDEGEYICVQTTSIGHETYQETYTLKAFLPDETYLNLSVLDEDYKVVGLGNVEMVQWVIQVSAYPKATLEWNDPNGTKIDINSGKLFVKNYGTLFKLVIKEIQVSDSGVYRLFAYNGAHEKNISVTLIVEDTSNGLDIIGPSTIVVGDKIIIKCRASKNKYLNDIKWIHHTFNSEESQISINESVSIVNYETEFSYESNLTITDIKHTFDGTIKCVVRETTQLNKNDIETVSTELPLKVQDSEVPIIYNSSNWNSLRKLGDSVQWWCYAHGVPPPTIIWLKDNRPLRFDENYFKVFMQNNNQTLVITVTDLEDEGNYVCNVSNGVGSAISISNLNFTDLRGPVIYNSSAPNNSQNIDETILLWCFVSGIPYPNISWYKNDKPLPLPNENYERMRLLNGSQILSINHVKQEDQGNYSCHVSNIIGRVESSSELIVTDPREKYFTPTVVLSYFIMFLICGSGIVTCAVKFLKLDVLKFFNENNVVKKWNSDLEIHEQVDLLSYDHRWEFPRNKLKIGKQLGYGAFGVVFKAEATDIVDKNITSTVAVKMMRLNNDPSYRKGLTSELKIMIHVGQHLNIVNLLGACTGSLTQSLMVIVEYCHFGNIYQYLIKKRDSFINQVTPDDKLDYNIQTIPKNKCNENYKIYRSVHSEIYEDSGSPITCDCYVVPFEDEYPVRCADQDRKTSEQLLCTHDLIYWSFQIATGMEYLASRKVLHGDLAARNILLTEKNIVKISDFGLAKTMYNSEYYKKKPEEGLVPVKWMAIESLRDHVFSTQSDVWSFGIVMWEMFSLSVTPYPNIFTFEDLVKRLIEGYRMALPKYANSKIYSIMLNCWDQEPTDRPSFTDLAELLSDFLQSQTKSFYYALNEDYVTMNTKRSYPIDASRFLTPLSEINVSISSKTNKNSILEAYEHTSDDDVELSPMFDK